MASRSGEELAAGGFVAIIFYVFADINLSLYRIFKKKRGLYYWCMVFGSWGCVISAIGIVLKFLLPAPKSSPIWPLYTTLLLLSWSIYAPAQLLILYSRLHLVNRNRDLARWILIMIVVVSALMIIPTWPLVFLAFNPYNQHNTSLYSPREAIVDRCTQIGYTIAECVISGVYIYSLFRLLNMKSSVRQRRVMIDLIYINIIAISLDFLAIILVFLNQTGISHPIQTFSYILKIKLEFMVLNQLMAVAARGVQKESFAERRYYHPSTSTTLAGERSSFLDTKSKKQEQESLEEQVPKSDSSGSELVVPSSTLSKAIGTTSYASGGKHAPQDHAEGIGKWPLQARSKKCGHKRASGKSGTEKDEEDEIGVHLWEKNGALAMEIPWFKVEEKA